MMSGWTTKRFDEIGKCIRGVSYRPDDLREAPGPTAITLLRSNNIRDGRLNFQNLQFVDKSAVRSDQQLQGGDVAICMSNGNRALVGKAGKFTNTNDGLKYTVGAFCSIFRPSNDYDTDFVRHQFGSPFYQKQLDVILAGSAINNLKGSDVGALIALCPESPLEQSKIAEVLSKVDKAIEQTESLIAKQQRIKTGLMQDLLTRGIDERGNLRSEETHKFKDSILGRIPVEWEVKELGNICDVTSSKRIYFRDYKSDGIHFYRSKEIIELSTQGATQGELYIAHNKYEEIGEKFGVPSDGDILISSVGTLGICYLVKKTDRFYFKDGNLLWFRKFKCLINSLFLLNLLPKMIEIQFDNLVIGTSQKAFTIEKLKKMNLFFPKGEEQDRIAKAILHEQITNDLCVCQLSKLRALKTALMQDLLTGKKRVTPLMEATEVCS